MVRETVPSESGFAAKVRLALAERTEYLIEHGLASRNGVRLVLTPNLVRTLRQRELQAAAKAIEGQSGLVYRPTEEGQKISGVYRRTLLLVSGRFAVLDDATGFSLVPWRPVIETRLGQQINAVVRGDFVSWEFGRNRGLSR